MKKSLQSLTLILGAALVLLVGIAGYKGDYFLLLDFKYIADVFQAGFGYILFYLGTWLLFIFAVLSVIIAVLNIFGIIKSAKVVGTFAILVGVFALIALIGLIIVKANIAALIITLVLGILTTIAVCVEKALIK